MAATQHTLGPGFLSASRSCLTRDPISGKAFFYKASAARSVGPWKGKRVDAALTQASVLTGKLTQQVKKRMKFDSLIPLEEPLGILIQTEGVFETDRGVIFRSLGDFPANKHYLLPVFSALHSVEGRRVAELNSLDPDSKAPFRYWKTHLMIPLARAAAELLATATTTRPRRGNRGAHLLKIGLRMCQRGPTPAGAFGDSDMLRQLG